MQALASWAEDDEEKGQGQYTGTQEELVKDLKLVWDHNHKKPITINRPHHI